MVVVADPAAGTVTLRLSTVVLALRVVVAAVAGIGAPLLAERWAPELLVPALLVTVAAAAWVVHGLGRTVVLDDLGVTIGTSRRRARRVPWELVAALTVEHGRLRLTTSDGRVLDGPRLTADVLAAAREDAALLGLLPESHRRR